MNLYLRHVKPLGFSGTGMFSDAKWHDLYRRKNPQQRAVTYISMKGGGYQIGVFRLTDADWLRFEDGSIALVPPGSCCPAKPPAGIIENAEVKYDGPIKSAKHLTELLKELP